MSHHRLPVVRALGALAVLALAGCSLTPSSAAPGTPATGSPGAGHRTAGGSESPVGPEAADGVTPEGTTVFDTDLPALANLDPALLAAAQAAATDAAEDGIVLRVTAGWRSEALQTRLFEQAVDRYGSEREARRFVATPDRSRHVTGEAIDIGPTDAAYWLVQHGSEHGLCQTYANEVWHFELATTPGGTCPAMLPDASVEP